MNRACQVERIDECLILEETAIARLASGMDVELKNIGKNWWVLNLEETVVAWLASGLATELLDIERID